MFKKHLVEHNAFKACDNCGFVWLPMSDRFRHDCPKCSPNDNKMQVETDEEYLSNEVSIHESVDSSMITYSEPRLVA